MTSDSSETEGSSHVCVECGTQSPVTETNYTLISARHGWRLTLAEVGGVRTMEWRCPQCWSKRKGASRP
jgi:hypothetical protein